MNLDQTANVAELAELFGVHRHTIENWIKDGLPATRGVTPGDPVLAQLRAAVRWVRARDEERSRKAIEKARGGDEDSAKARKLAAEAKLKEMLVAEREGKLVPAGDVEARWTERVGSLREALRAIPGMAVQAGLVAARDEVRLESMLRDALVSYARTVAKVPSE